ncbi:MAG: hypothetical protein P8010_12510 [Desulfosarcinaceae bacterium]
MQARNQFMKGLALGAAVILGLLFLTGTVTTQTYNVTGDDTVSFTDLACSSDGKIVYVADVETVYKSVDGGLNWTVALKKGTAAE